MNKNIHSVSTFQTEWFTKKKLQNHQVQDVLYVKRALM